MGTAVAEDILAANPCRIRGAGTTKRVKKVKPATVAELSAIAEAMPERYRAMVLMAAWCALRFGELAELRRKDVDLARGVVHVRRGVTRANGEVHVGTPKSDEATRDVNMPKALIPVWSNTSRSTPGCAGGPAVPRAQRRTPCPQHPLQGLLPRARQGRTARPALP